MALGAQAQAKATPEAGIMVSTRGDEEATLTAIAITEEPGDRKRSPVTDGPWSP